MIHELRYLARITWCRFAGGHRTYILRSVVDGAPLSVQCTRCPLVEAAE